MLETRFRIASKNSTNTLEHLHISNSSGYRAHWQEGVVNSHYIWVSCISCQVGKRKCTCIYVDLYARIC
jgi:hypothetical protein